MPVWLPACASALIPSRLSVCLSACLPGCFSAGTTWSSIRTTPPQRCTPHGVDRQPSPAWCAAAAPGMRMRSTRAYKKTTTNTKRRMRAEKLWFEVNRAGACHSLEKSTPAGADIYTRLQWLWGGLTICVWIGFYVTTISSLQCFFIESVSPNAETFHIPYADMSIWSWKRHSWTKSSLRLNFTCILFVKKCNFAKQINLMPTRLLLGLCISKN